MDIQEEIYKTIENIFHRFVSKLNLSYQVAGVVLGSSRGKYIVSINGEKRLLKDGVGINPQPNTAVWVCIPNNDINQAYICARK